MDDSDDYGDLDDSAFIAAATQAEQTPFQPSSRPNKRRKTGATASIPPSNTENNRPAPFAESGDEDEPASVTNPASRRRTERSCPSAGRPSASPPNQTKRVPRKAKEDGHFGDETVLSEHAKKKRERIHVPTTDLDLTDVFYTQPPQEHSPPWKPRGAIWAKPTLNIGINFPTEPSPPQSWARLDTIRKVTVSERHSIASRPVSRRSTSPGRPSSSPEEASPFHLTAAGVANHDYDFTQELADLPSDAFESSSSPQKQTDDVLLVSENRRSVVASHAGLRQTTLFGRDTANGATSASQARKRPNFVADQKAEPPTQHELDLEAAKTWVYPTNIGVVRDYQFNIVAKGLFNNLLVALPTGLGKTFIAATVMLNWYRWTTNAQIVFVAPTKPLVAQQIDACFHIAGIPRHDTTMLTGNVAPGLRAEEWKNKRVMFMTPQTLLNDLKSGIADPKRIVLLVVDEAHKATGAYAYVEAVSLIRRFNQSYRILALTATPGADVEAVQKVIDGLDISRIEIRTENSLDIRQYVHQRSVEKHTFDNSEEMEMCMELYREALRSCVQKVHGAGAFWSPDPVDLTPYGCNQSQRKWFQDGGRTVSQGVKGMVQSIFAILGSLSQGMELLKYHGIGPFYMKMREFRDANIGSKSKYKKEIVENKAFKELLTRLQVWVNTDDFVGHPKLSFLQQIVLDHFLEAGEGRHTEGAPSQQTRIMVFAHFRDSAEEIVRILRRHEPMIRPRVFVGQSSGKNSEGMTQADQLNVIKQFKAGKFNTLVATSIGEEGLDIGEVDLIVCYDSKASPIRMLQRMGRTGRKRQGRIVLLQMKGKEERDALAAKDSYEKMQELIAEGSRFTFHDDISKRILPREVQPVVDKRRIEIPLENSQSNWLPEPRKSGRAPKRPPKKFHMPDGVITGFVTANRMDQEIATSKSRVTRKPAPTYPSEEPYAVPPLETVLLDDKAMKDLERRYQTVFDDDDAPIVGPLSLGRDPVRQRRLSRPVHFRTPGAVTQRFVKTLQKMHEMDNKPLDELRRHIDHTDWESDAEAGVVVPNGATTASVPTAVVEIDEWESDHPASQPIPPSKSQAATKRKPTAARKSVDKPTTMAPPPLPTTPAPRGRPRKAASTPMSLPRRSASRTSVETPSFRVTGMAEEGASSSPPPTDPRFLLPTQGVDLGSDDTVAGDEDIDDTQAYLLDSDLRSFIAQDEEDVDVSDSSLPSVDMVGFGRGTQAVVESAKAKKPRRVQKLFTSDITDDGAGGAVLSSDSDDDAPLVTSREVPTKKTIHVLDSECEDSVVAIAPSRKRVRRVIEDDDEDE